MGTALLVVDVQNDFITGSLAVPHGEEVVPVLNGYINQFRRAGDSVFYSMDAHPAKHCSFKEQGGLWPPHCVMGTEGQKLHPDLVGPRPSERILIIGKAFDKNKDAYSAFDDTYLSEMLKERKITELYVGGLATEYCVRATVMDARKLGFSVTVLTEACRAVEVDKGLVALNEMAMAGATITGSLGAP